MVFPIPVNGDILGLLEDGYGQLQLAKGVAIVSLTILVYDWMTSFHLEVAYIWGASWSYGRILYHLNRVWPMILLGTSLPVILFHHSPQPSVCRHALSFYAYGCLAANSVISMVLIARCWALYGGRCMFWALCVGLVCATISTIVIANRMIDKVIYLPQFLPGILSGCTVIAPTDMWKGLIPSTVYELLLFALTLWKLTTMAQQFGATPLSRRLAEHGIIYFAVRVVLIAFSCIGGYTRSVQIATNASGFLVAASSVVCSRMTFSLYELDDKRRAAMTSLASNDESWSVPEFAIPLVSMNDTSFKQTLVV